MAKFKLESGKNWGQRKTAESLFCSPPGPADNLEELDGQLETSESPFAKRGGRELPKISVQELVRKPD